MAGFGLAGVSGRGLKAVVALCAALLLAAPALATTVFKYRDADGVWHYSDQRPAAGTGHAQLEVLQLFGSTPAQQRTVRIERRGDPATPALYAVNENHAPVQLKLDLKRLDNLRPAGLAPGRSLPDHFLVPARGELRLVALQRVGPGSTGLDYDYRWQLGDPAAQPDANYAYLAPIPTSGSFRVTQSFNGGFSHRGDSGRYAVDIAMPVGTAVRAARGGLVISVTDQHIGGGNSPGYRDQTNSVYVMHDDGTFGVYAHLRHRSALVKPGQRVERGQILAQSGNTGYSTAPHLHFAVLRNAGMKWRSIPFEMASGSGIGVPKRGIALSHEPSGSGRTRAVASRETAAVGAAD
jgi:murein DD-endopeptidase MepM/ murein hydrolase activator NlpD